MRVSLDWLNNIVSIAGLEPKDIAEALTNSGLEVESIETVGGAFSDVLVGKVIAVAQHPNADRLRLVTVNLGAKGQNEVVCGAPNVAVDQRIAYAQVGAKVIDKKNGGLFELTPAKIRGVASTGMICSLEELGLENQYTPESDGIWPVTSLTNDSDLGQDLKAVLQLKTDIILDVTPNANRGDLMSMVGVAREVAALFNRELCLPAVNPIQSSQPSPFKVQLTDESVCSFYAGAELQNITIAPSPEWMQQRLVNAGIRSINNVVDVTNYVMLEIGQPLHAFDIFKLGESGTINVRKAKAGETLRSLDGMNRPLMENLSVVVTVDDKPIALAGVMGGEETQITEATQHVFLEAAYFPSASNRKSARSVGLRSESSARFERGVDSVTCETAFYRAIALLEETAGATLKSITLDDHRQPYDQQISLPLIQIEKVLGLAIPSEKVTQILTHLGFTGFDSATTTSDTLTVKVPSFRMHDVTRPIDVIEELIRIYGYDTIPYTLPQGTATPIQSPRAKLLTKIRQLMVGSGLAEASTLSLIGDALLAETGFSQDMPSTVAVTNSHSVDHTFLRQSLIPSLVNVAKYNLAQGNDAVWLFELGKTYRKTHAATEKNAGVSEKLMLGILITGTPDQGAWHRITETDFYTLKGIAENLLSHLGVLAQTRWSPLIEDSGFHPGQTAQVKLGKAELGTVGRLHPLIQDSLKLKLPIYLLQFDVEVLFETLQKKSSQPVAEALSAYPSVKRDMAMSAPISVSHQQIIKAIEQVQDPQVKELVQDIALFDEYRGTQLGDGNRSLAYRLTLQSGTGTLTESEIDAVVDKLKKQLSEQLAVTFR